MFFFNDECDLVDDDQYDFFTLATQVERRRRFVDRPCSRQTDKDWHCFSLAEALGNPEA